MDGCSLHRRLRPYVCLRSLLLGRYLVGQQEPGNRICCRLRDQRQDYRGLHHGPEQSGRLEDGIQSLRQCVGLLGRHQSGHLLFLCRPSGPDRLCHRLRGATLRDRLVWRPRETGRLGGNLSSRLPPSTLWHPHLWGGLPGSLRALLAEAWSIGRHLERIGHTRRHGRNIAGGVCHVGHPLPVLCRLLQRCGCHSHHLHGPLDHRIHRHGRPLHLHPHRPYPGHRVLRLGGILGDLPGGRLRWRDSHAVDRRPERLQLLRPLGSLHDAYVACRRNYVLRSPLAARVGRGRRVGFEESLCHLMRFRHPRGLLLRFRWLPGPLVRQSGLGTRPQLVLFRLVLRV
mmetsp:Transcript_12268/g.26846  ORF Transcript_12268/g.26846 Transcript_12268/m.26846 type:complete len:342 (+) Transcript_12268:135-1160(+)